MIRLIGIIIFFFYSLAVQAQEDSAASILRKLYLFEWKDIQHWQKKQHAGYHDKLVQTYCYWWFAITTEERGESLRQCRIWAEQAAAEADRRYRKEGRHEDVFFKVLAVIMKARVENLEGNSIRSAFTLKSIAGDCIATLGKEHQYKRFNLTSGLYYYFMAGVESKYRFMKPFLKGYPSGDRAKGLALLSQGSTRVEDAFLSTECMYILMRIYMEEDNLKLANRYASRLIALYPNNPVFVYYFNKSTSPEQKKRPVPVCYGCSNNQQAYIRKLNQE